MPFQLHFIGFNHFYYKFSDENKMHHYTKSRKKNSKWNLLYVKLLNEAGIF